MKKFIVSFMMAAALVFSGSMAMAFDFNTENLSGMYVTPKIGIGYVEMDDIHSSGTSYSHDHDQAFVTSLAVGYDFDKKFELPVRAEVEYLYRGRIKTVTEKGRIDNEVHALMANASYDFKEVPVVTPYITAGLGTALVGDDSVNFAYNFGGGVYYNVTENAAIDFSVRYIDYGRVLKEGYKMDQSGANIMLGLRYTF